VTPEQIEELFISAAETDARLPDTARPARLKAQAVPYYHSEIDVNGWGAERYQEERADFLSHRTTRLRKAEISQWELCNELMTFVPRERDRRCLWAWAMSEAKVLRTAKAVETRFNSQANHKGKICELFSMETVMKRISFSRWCKDVEGIHRNTGAIRKDVAISCIEAIFLRNTLADIRKLQSCTLQEYPDFGDKEDILDEQREFSWSDPNYFTGEFWKASRFNPDKMRNDQRRARERKRKEQQAA
jgi:hypothetical protein